MKRDIFKILFRGFEGGFKWDVWIKMVKGNAHILEYRLFEGGFKWDVWIKMVEGNAHILDYASSVNHKCNVGGVSALANNGLLGTSNCQDHVFIAKCATLCK